MKFPTIEEIVRDVAEKAIDEYAYKGRTIRQWIEIIYNAEHGTNLAEVGTDCISRRQAIETFKDCAVNGVGIDGIVDALKQLPPIQPVITQEQAVEYLQSTGWMREHDLQMMLDGVHRLTAQPRNHSVYRM